MIVRLLAHLQVHSPVSFDGQGHQHLYMYVCSIAQVLIGPCIAQSLFVVCLFACRFACLLVSLVGSLVLCSVALRMEIVLYGCDLLLTPIPYAYIDEGINEQLRMLSELNIRSLFYICQFSHARIYLDLLL